MSDHKVVLSYREPELRERRRVCPVSWESLETLLATIAYVGLWVALFTFLLFAFRLAA